MRYPKITTKEWIQTWNHGRSNHSHWFYYTCLDDRYRIYKNESNCEGCHFDISVTVVARLLKMNVDSAKAGMVYSRKKFCLKHEYYTIPYVLNSILEIGLLGGYQFRLLSIIMYVKSNGDLGSLERYFSGSIWCKLFFQMNVSENISFIEDFFSHDSCSAIEKLVWIGFVSFCIRRRDVVDDDVRYSKKK